MPALPPPRRRSPDDRERRRQAALDDYQLVDTMPEQAYEDILKLAVMLCEVPAAAISLIDRDRQWFKAQVGLDVEQIPRSESICDMTIRSPGRLLVAEDLTADPRYAHVRLMVRGQRVAFYAGAPLRSPEGHALGTLCVMDTVPRRLTELQLEGVELLARQTQHLFELRRYANEQRHLLLQRELVSQQLEASRADLQRRHDKLKHSASHDPLTGLLNRAALAQLRASGESMALLEASPYTLMLIDVDLFKQVNDRYGHLLGDRALRAVADAVASGIREGDVAVRYGGEEILVVLPGTRVAGAAEVAERIRLRVMQAPLPFPLTVSIGLAGGEPGRDTQEEVFVRADQALYRAKANGRNQVQADDTPTVGSLVEPGSSL
ncbi:MAG: sensor domain-containing diguanylate cyclase [Pseudomonadota bacterium]|nr:sensor domain-containing diguanylate cyclase [Pseudomonadota bacterium]